MASGCLLSASCMRISLNLFWMTCANYIRTAWLLNQTQTGTSAHHASRQGWGSAALPQARMSKCRGILLEVHGFACALEFLVLSAKSKVSVDRMDASIDAVVSTTSAGCQSTI
eukprot:jgi/Ulvmu1/5926/UM026_0048.1